MDRGDLLQDLRLGEKTGERPREMDLERRRPTGDGDLRLPAGEGERLRGGGRCEPDETTEFDLEYLRDLRNIMSSSSSGCEGGTLRFARAVKGTCEGGGGGERVRERPRLPPRFEGGGEIEL